MSNAATGTQREYRIIMITITPGSTPTVDLPKVHVNKDRQDVVVWSCPPGQNFMVCFGTDTPFNDYHFHPGHNDSGPATRGVKGKTYKYTVEAGGGRIDPSIIVE